MTWKIRQIFFLFALVVVPQIVVAQQDQTDRENALDKLINLPVRISEKYSKAVYNKVNRVTNKLKKHAERTLQKAIRQEQKMIRAIERSDSNLAVSIKNISNSRLLELKKSLADSSGVNQYLPSIDSTTAVLSIISSTNLPRPVSVLPESATKKLEQLKLELNNAEKIKQFISQKKQLLKERIEGFGLTKKLKKLSKTGYYYSQKILEFKGILNDRKLIEKKVLELCSKTKIFQDFLKKNSLISTLFPSLSVGGNQSATGFAGLQTRTQLASFIQQSTSITSSAALSQLQANTNTAQSQLAALRTRLSTLAGSGSSELEMPDFKPNSMKTKSFWKRLEYGINLQSQKGNRFFVVSSDVGFSLGYKLNEKSIVGIGGNFKIGWGKGWNNIRLTSEGVGIRSFLEIKVKDKVWITGGYEQNFRNAIRRIEELKNSSAWQVSGLIGVSKTVNLKSKWFKKTKVQLLWDFMSYRQLPRTEPLKFRIGYTF